MVTKLESRLAGEKSTEHGRMNYTLEFRSQKLRRFPSVIMARGIEICKIRWYHGFSRPLTDEQALFLLRKSRWPKLGNYSFNIEISKLS